MKLFLTSAKMGMLALLMASASARAQTDPGSLERTVPQLEVDDRDPARIEAPVVRPESSARIAQTFVLSAVVIEGATLFSSEELAESFEPYLASEVGQEQIDRIASDITERYRKAGYILSYAVVPEQSVQSGIVHVRVVEGFIGNIRLVGNKRSAEAVQSIFHRLTLERPLRRDTLERAIGLGRDTPGAVISDVRISRSEANPAHHVLTVSVGADRYRALAYLDNRGTIDGARVRAYSSFSLASLAVPGDQLQVDLFTVPYSDFRYAYGQLKGSVPLGADGLRLIASASYGDQFQRLSGPNQDGAARTFTAEIAYPFVKSRAFTLSGHLQFADWKSRQERAGATIQKDRLQVVRSWVEFNRASKVRLNGKVGLSQGLDLGPATEEGDPLASRPLADGTFTKFNANVQLTSQLSQRVRLRTEAAAQYATRPLLVPEEFALGGSRIGRAFDFNEITGDHGIGAIIELSFRPGDAKKLAKAPEFFAYVDGGGAFRDRSSPGLPKSQWLAGTGAGVRMTLLGISWSAEMGVPIARSGEGSDVRAFFSAFMTF